MDTTSRSYRLSEAYRHLAYPKAWELWRRGHRSQALLLDRVAREAAWIALLEETLDERSIQIVLDRMEISYQGKCNARRKRIQFIT